MNRKKFLKSTAVGIGAFSMIPMLNACKTESTKEAESESSEVKEKPSLEHKIVTNDNGDKLNVLGDNQTIKLTGKDTNGQFTLIEQNNDPGVGIPPHVHENEDEVFQVLSGKVEMSIDNTTTVLQAGDLIFCPKGVPHSWRVVGDEKAKAMLSVFPAGLEDMFSELSQLPSGPPDMKKVTDICAKYKLKFV